MPYAIVPLVPWKPHPKFPGGLTAPLGHDIPGRNWILLDQGALIWTPSTILDARAQTLGDAKGDTLPPNRRAILEAKLGDRAFAAGDRLEQMIVGMFLNPPVGKWGQLRPSFMRQRFEILLGPDKGKLFWSQAQFVPKRSVTRTDNFNRTNGNLSGTTSSDGTFAWVQGTGSGAGNEWEILSNSAQCVNIVSGSFSVEHTDTDVDSDDYFVQCTISNWSRGGGLLDHEFAARGSTYADGGDGYATYSSVNGAGTNDNGMYRWDTGAALDTDSSETVTSGTKRFEVDGTTIRTLHVAVEYLSATNSVFAGGAGKRRAALCSYADDGGTNANDLGAEGFSYGDLAAAAAFIKMVGNNFRLAGAGGLAS